MLPSYNECDTHSPLLCPASAHTASRLPFITCVLLEPAMCTAHTCAMYRGSTAASQQQVGHGGDDAEAVALGQRLVARPRHQHRAPPGSHRRLRLGQHVGGEQQLRGVVGADGGGDVGVRRLVTLGARGGVEESAQVGAQVAHLRVAEEQALRLARAGAVDVGLEPRAPPLRQRVGHVAEQLRAQRAGLEPGAPHVALQLLQRAHLAVGRNGSHHPRAHALNHRRLARARLGHNSAVLRRLLADGRDVGLRLLAGVARLQVRARVALGEPKHGLCHVADGRHGALNVQHDGGGQLRAWRHAADAGPLGCGLAPGRMAVPVGGPVGRGQRGGCGRARVVQTQPPHLHRRLEQVVVALGLRLGVDPVLAPHVHAVAAHQHRVGARVVGDGLAQPVGELALARRVLDDGHREGVVEAVTLQALDHLHVRDLELGRVGLQQRGQHAPHGVRVDDGARVAQLVRRHEERRALGQLGRPRGRRLGRGRVHHLALGVQHKHVVGLHALLLHAAGRHDDEVGVRLDRDSTAGARHRALVVQVQAQVADEALSLLHFRGESLWCHGPRGNRSHS
mmetsp:Transcript_28725/g.73055  ORF Transcript_28725/g.73055 Transcript_28725/m.73055 type:complete len:565 (+) Transcript_28725:210-1904(+)